MFYLLTYAQYAIVAVCALLAPAIIPARKDSYKLFGFLIFELHLSQLFMYAPGLDVSPYAYAKLGLYPINIGGLSLAAFTSIVIIWFVVVDLLTVDYRIPRSLFVLFILALVPNLIALIRSPSAFGYLSDFVKILAPFLVMIYIHKGITARNKDWFIKLITWINLLTVGQTFFSKLLYGTFSVHNYYYEIAEETFGFYNHPHAFTGLLAFLAIWNIYQVNKKRQVKLNLMLFATSILLMFFSGVRTYVVALAAGLAYIGIKGLFSSSTKNIRKYIYFAMCVAILIGPYVLSLFGAARVTGDISSGRFHRWAMDISYMLAEPLDVFLLGGGMGFIEKINVTVEGWEINSLNLFVDCFANYGVLGMIAMVTAYRRLLVYYMQKNTLVFYKGIVAVFLVASIINSITIYIAIMTQIVLMLRVIAVDNEMVYVDTGG